MRFYSPQKYWANLADNYGRSDQMGFSPVLHPHAPAWFNRCVDSLQKRAWLRAIALCKQPKSASVLDVGCGTGRWVRRYSELGYSAVGSDGSFAMLRRASELRTVTPLAVGHLQSLPFRDEVFDCVSAITVIQHIPESEQSAAIKEMIRVLKCRGYVILLEVTRDRAAHVFPHRPSEWLASMQACGLELVDWFGEEFLLFDRVITTAVSFGRRIFSEGKENDLIRPGETLESGSHFGGFARRVYWQARRISMGLSAWTEPLADRVCPPDWATHATFVFRKRGERP
jgi:SAM-dependent methyltransferase